MASILPGYFDTILPAYFGTGIGDDVGVKLGKRVGGAVKKCSNFDRKIPRIPDDDSSKGEDSVKLPRNLLESSAACSIKKIDDSNTF